jgi:hypothetical protein
MTSPPSDLGAPGNRSGGWGRATRLDAVDARLQEAEDLVEQLLALGPSVGFKEELLTGGSECGVREEWVRTRDNDQAVTAGVEQTGRTIATAAAIMFCVFASFGFAGLRTASEFGVGLAVAVAADALLIRMTVFPAIMRVRASQLGAAGMARPRPAQDLCRGPGRRWRGFRPGAAA